MYRIFYRVGLCIAVGLQFSSLSAKSLDDYGVNNGRLETYIAENQLDPDNAIESIRTAEDVGVASAFYATVWSEINSASDLEEIQSLTELYVTGINSVTRSYVLKRMWVPPFKPEYFNEAAKETLRTPDRPNAFQYDYIHALGIAGVDHPEIDLSKYIEGKSLEESLKLPPILEVAGDSQRYTSSAWAARVVLARRGDEAALDGVLEAVSSMDELKMAELRKEVLINLGYIRQPEAIDILIDVLFSDFGTSENPYPDYIAKNWDARPFCYLAVRPLALAFDDFPVDYWKPYISNLDVDAAREYILNYQNPPKAVEEPIEDPIAEIVEAPTVEVREPVEVAPVEVAEETPEQPSRWWLWLIGAVVVVGCVLFIRSKNERL